MLVSGWREEAQVPSTADMFGSQQKHILGEGPHSNFDWKWKCYSLGLFHAAYSHLVNYEHQHHITEFWVSLSKN